MVSFAGNLIAYLAEISEKNITASTYGSMGILVAYRPMHAEPENSITTTIATISKTSGRTYCCGFGADHALNGFLMAQRQVTLNYGYSTVKWTTGPTGTDVLGNLKSVLQDLVSRAGRK